MATLTERVNELEKELKKRVLRLECDHPINSRRWEQITSHVYLPSHFRDVCNVCGKKFQLYNSRDKKIEEYLRAGEESARLKRIYSISDKEILKYLKVRNNNP